MTHCNYTDAQTGATHAEIIDSLRWELKNRVKTTAAAYRRLSKIKDIIESVDQRASAADGPVTDTRQEMTNAEMRQIYRAAKGRK